MNIRNYIKLTLMALPMLLMQSCLKDQEDAFPESASKRLTNLIDKTEETLIGAENGWQLDYYYGNNVTEGGVPMTLTFEKGKVSVASDADTTKVYESHWSMVGDNGAVLSFDSYNALLHRYATPSSSKYQADQGDFEFVIDSVGADEIHVHGKKNGQPLVFRRLTKDRKQYISEELEQKNENYLKMASANIGGKDVVLGFNWNDCMATITVDNNSTISMPFTHTDKGIRFFKPFTVSGKTISNFEFVDDSVTMENVKYNTLDPGSTDIVFMAKYPEGYRHLTEWGGEYTFRYLDKEVDGQPVEKDVTITYRPDSMDYVMNGFYSDDGTEAVPIVLKWSKATGMLELHTQLIKRYSKNSRYDIYLWFSYWTGVQAVRRRNTRCAFTLRQDATNKKKFYWTNNGEEWVALLNGQSLYPESILFFRQYRNKTGTPLYLMTDWPYLFNIESLTQK